MGFFDKVKEAGKGALKGALVMAATPYGTVLGGKHKLCKVCLNSTFDKISFVKVTNIEGEYEIKEAIKTFYLFDEDDSIGHHVITVVFNDGEESRISLTYQKDQGSGLSSASQRVAAQYSKAGDLVEALGLNVAELSDDTKKWANKIMLYAGKKAIF